jgi:hypothetical protein
MPVATAPETGRNRRSPSVAVSRTQRDTLCVARSWRAVAAVVLFGNTAWSLYAVLVAITEGTRESDPALYWTSTALLAGFAFGTALLGRHLWRKR